MKSPPDGRFPPRLAAGGWAPLLAQSRGGFESLWVPGVVSLRAGSSGHAGPESSYDRSDYVQGFTTRKKATENGRCITKLENMGFRVGQGLIERFTKDTARFKDELDIMKFICKDFWTTVFKKQIDNLRTNHQGIYVLQDNKFRLLTQMSAGKQYLEHASKYLAFTCGLIRGGLSNLGIKSIVTAEVSSMPACKFQVMIQKL
ncbi:trafficking protein particle complex subunit 6B isoform X1 [Physeter macrocephalus]|uniref:Trafficking protein particle complex subunit 6B n=9 Tax=Boreoeutheria TaxID=1437010 RepID=A0A2Y9F941_PHYMC|nr:trafficking protein particle complex subunit 6B isoform X1 [Physeter catodon]|eukprot:XP_007117575.2 trafficking protein particle complex subunit 6B isoform X1 [Physeter catodon]